jgi:hypothetical protein
MVFRNGRVIATKVGDVNHKDLADWIDQFL